MSQTIYVRCISTNQLEWSEDNQSWAQLASSRPSAPLIDVTSSSPVTFDFRLGTGGNYDVVYNDGGTPVSVGTSSGPSIVINPSSGDYPEFSRDQSEKRWYVGHVTVSPDSL